MNKAEIISKMREHQQEYAKYATELKKITSAEDQKATEERQLARLEEYKGKYTLYVKIAEDLSDVQITPIDFNELEKLIRSSFIEDAATSYALGYDSSGMEGLGYSIIANGNATPISFTPMVEDEREAERFVAREKRRREYAARVRSK